jgi:hypothetical protein
MESLNKEMNYSDIKIRVESSVVSDLTKEIALALIEIKQMHEGKIKPLTLKDV